MFVLGFELMLIFGGVILQFTGRDGELQCVVQHMGLHNRSFAGQFHCKFLHILKFRSFQFGFSISIFESIFMVFFRACYDVGK